MSSGSGGGSGSAGQPTVDGDWEEEEDMVTSEKILHLHSLLLSVQFWRTSKLCLWLCLQLHSCSYSSSPVISTDYNALCVPYAAAGAADVDDYQKNNSTMPPPISLAQIIIIVVLAHTNLLCLNGTNSGSSLSPSGFGFPSSCCWCFL